MLRYDYYTKGKVRHIPKGHKNDTRNRKKFKGKRNRNRKEPYLYTNAYRKFKQYETWKYLGVEGSAMSFAMVDALYQQANRPGFVRQFLAAQAGEPIDDTVRIPPNEPEGHAIFRKLLKVPYDRRKSYRLTEEQEAEYQQLEAAYREHKTTRTSNYSAGAKLLATAFKDI